MLMREKKNTNVLKHLNFFFKCFKTLDFFIFEEIKNFKCSTTFDFFFDTTFEFLVGCGGLWQQQNSCEFHPGFYQNSSRNRWPRNFIEILQGFLLEFWLPAAQQFQQFRRVSGISIRILELLWYSTRISMRIIFKNYMTMELLQ